MGYRPDHQSLEPSLKKILEGIDEFEAAAKARIDAGQDWQDSHLAQLGKLLAKFAKLRPKLVKLRDENW